MADQERLARVALNSLAEPGDRRLALLVAGLGAVEVHQRLLAACDLDGIATDVAARLAAIDPGRTLEQAERMGIRFVVPGDAEWPDQLLDLDRIGSLNERGGAPLGLWVRGPLPLGELTGSVAVVGSRSATGYGTSVAADLAAALARSGRAVVSGAAFGIDQAAHRGALGGGGATVAVLACGVDRVYPKGHEQLLGYLAAEAAVIAEAPPGWTQTRIRFLARNRLIAALTGGTVVVEAALRSGALNTANWAGRLHRQVMGVPGPVTSAPSQGVHELIRSGAATLVSCGEDIAELLAAAGQDLPAPRRGPERVRDRLTARQQQVLDAVPVVRAASVSSIARTSGVAEAEVAATLAMLLEADLVTRRGGDWRLAAAAQGVLVGLPGVST